MLFIANTNYKLKCVNSTNVPIDLSTCATITPMTSNTTNVDNKPVILQLSISITGAQTPIITDKNGASVTPCIIQGSSEKTEIDNRKICLGDPIVTGLVDINLSKVSKGDVTIIGTAGSQSQVSDKLTIWISDAGQDKVEVE